MEFTQYPITILIIALNVILSVWAFNNSNVMNKAIMWPYGVVRNKQYYRFISSGFIHADFMHLFFNMFTFFFFGSAVEQYFVGYQLGGEYSYLALYFLGLILSDYPTFLKQKNNSAYLCLGASGAVSAVVFAAIIFDPWSKIYLYGALGIPAALYAVLYIVYCVYMGKKSSDHINHDAHLWGSLFGLVFTITLIAIIDPHLFELIIEQLKHPHFLGK
ncbi:MAG: rhomboid family intramembrane serine protease [Chitinophagaceae bacterium]